MKKTVTGRIRFNDRMRLREVKGDPYIFLNLQTYQLVIIPVEENSEENQVLSLVVKRLKKGITFEALLNMVVEKFTIERDEATEELRKLIEQLAANDMLKVRN